MFCPDHAIDSLHDDVVFVVLWERECFQHTSWLLDSLGGHERAHDPPLLLHHLWMKSTAAAPLSHAPQRCSPPALSSVRHVHITPPLHCVLGGRAVRLLAVGEVFSEGGGGGAFSYLASNSWIPGAIKNTPTLKPEPPLLSGPAAPYHIFPPDTTLHHPAPPPPSPHPKAAPPSLQPPHRLPVTQQITHSEQAFNLRGINNR